VISQRTVVWFLLMLGFSADMEYDRWETNRPCREWKAVHPGVNPKNDVEEDYLLPNGTHVVSFNPCNIVLWQSMPLWVKLCALGWVVSSIGFVRSLSIDIHRWFIHRRSGTGKDDV